MKHIGNLTIARGSTKKRKRIGRGAGSGHGGTSTRGHKGHGSRSGVKSKVGFEGGQMPLARRVPKFGFKNPFRVEYQVVNVSAIQQLVDTNRITDGVVTPDILYAHGILRKKSMPCKVLGNGNLTATVTVSADKFSTSAIAKIESVGGTAITNG